MNSKEQRRAAFNEQMNAWVSRQGILFQLRHSGDGQRTNAQVVRVGLRCAIFLILVLCVLWFYLIKRIQSEGFADGIQASVERSLKGSECKIGGIRKDRNVASISGFHIKGTEDSFFHSINARMVRFNIKLTDGMFGNWNGGGVRVDNLDMHVKAGERDDVVAAKSYKSLFDEHGSFSFETIEADNARITWGYSMNNRGSIKDSNLNAVRDGDVWRMEFKGGTFSQNWLQDLAIGKLIIICDDEGVHIKEGELFSGAGRLIFKLDIGSGGKPQVSGTFSLKSLPINKLIPSHYHDWIAGKISGEGTISGSTNSQQGIATDINISLKDGDQIVLRDTWPLLSALSVVDSLNSYRKVSFTEGGCHIRTGTDRLHVDNIDLKAGDLMSLTGEVIVRRPSYKEIAGALDLKDIKVVEDIIEKNMKKDDGLFISIENERLVEDTSGIYNEDKESADDVLEASILAEKNVRRFNGVVKFGLNNTAFNRAPELKKIYPTDQATGKIWLDIPLAGRLETLTSTLARQLYKFGRERN